MFTVEIGGRKYRVTWRFKHPKPNDLKGKPLMSNQDAKDWFERYGDRPPKELLASRYAKQHESHCRILEYMEVVAGTPEWYEVSSAVAKCWRGGYNEDADDILPADDFNKNTGRKHSLGMALSSLIKAECLLPEEVDLFWKAYNEMCAPKSDKPHKGKRATKAPEF